MHELHYNGSSDLRQLHKQDNIPPLIIHRAFRLVILILYFPLVRICQYQPDNWTLNGEISRQHPVRAGRQAGWLSNYHIDFKPERIELSFITEPLGSQIIKMNIISPSDRFWWWRWGRWCVAVRVGVHVLSISPLQLSQWSPSSRQEYLSQSICLPGNHCNPRWSLSPLSIYISLLTQLLRTQNHQKSFRSRQLC